MELEIKAVPGYNNTKLVKISGDLDVVQVSFFKKELWRYMEEGAANFIFDLRGLKFIDSVGNLSLINVHSEVKRRGGGLAFFGASSNIEEIFDMVGILRIVPLCDSYDSALAVFRNSAK